MSIGRPFLRPAPTRTRVLRGGVLLGLVLAGACRPVAPEYDVCSVSPRACGAVLDPQGPPLPDPGYPADSASFAQAESAYFETVCARCGLVAAECHSGAGSDYGCAARADNRLALSGGEAAQWLACAAGRLDRMRDCVRRSACAGGFESCGGGQAASESVELHCGAAPQEVAPLADCFHGGAAGAVSYGGGGVVGGQSGAGGLLGSGGESATAWCQWPGCAGCAAEQRCEAPGTGGASGSDPCANAASADCSRYEYAAGQVCDGDARCAARDDEAGCEPFECADGGGELPTAGRCDGEAQCDDGSDEADCPFTYCADGVEYLQTAACDGFEDCDGAEDEQDCEVYLCAEAPSVCDCPGA